MKHIASRLISPFLFSIVLSERVSFCSKVIELMQLPIKFIYIFSQWFWPLASFQLFGPVCGGIFKKVISMFLGTYLDYDYDTFFFSNAHRVTESKTQSNHVKSGQKLQCPSTAVGWSQILFSLPPGTSGQVGLLKLPIKWPYHNFIN